MSAWAKPGAKCVCIRDTPWIYVQTMTVAGNGPVIDEVCTIEQVVTHLEMGVGLVFVEHPDPHGGKAVFPIRFFRPVAPTAQAHDVAQFTYLLDQVEEPA